MLKSLSGLYNSPRDLYESPLDSYNPLGKTVYAPKKWEEYDCSRRSLRLLLRMFERGDSDGHPPLRSLITTSGVIITRKARATSESPGLSFTPKKMRFALLSCSKIFLPFLYFIAHCSFFIVHFSLLYNYCVTLHRLLAGKGHKGSFFMKQY